ncbi:hypothetical protein [Mycolicibacterium iranicum]|uniref:RNA-binding protein n=1 Tax=Mycolicibacterium iranicum TaxID=912594 RepID=A0ABT4HDV5_MYCIR|nr:hypothetical protein [Mycolicibacterium iranicum]MCZ0728376.1 hypothetical protein [Mycolicibacterium iranicum]
MVKRVRSLMIAGLAVAALPGAVVLIAPAGTASADVCVGGGRRIYVAGCADLTPDYYAPMPGDYPPPPVSGCVGWNGRWVHASGCN